MAPYFSAQRQLEILAYVAPQILFILAYELTDPMTAVTVLMVAGLSCCIWMWFRESGAFFFNLLSKFLLTLCAALSLFFGDIDYLKVWVSLYALLAAMLAVTARVTSRYSLFQYSEVALDISDRGIRLFYVALFFVFCFLCVLAELARVNLPMDSWIYFQLIVPSIYLWSAMLAVILVLHKHIVIFNTPVSAIIESVLRQRK